MGRPLRVALVTTSFPRFREDHAGHFVLRLAEALVAGGIEVEVLAPHALGAETEERWLVPAAQGADATVPGIDIRRFRYAADSLERIAYGDGIVANIKRDPMALLALPGFVRALRRATIDASARVDVVHAQWGQVAALATSPAVSAPMVVTLHGSDVAMAARGGIWRRLLLRGLAASVEAIAVSEELARRLHEVTGSAPVPPVAIVPTGVESALLRRPRPRLLTEPPLTVAFVGRLLEAKGVIELARAFGRLPGRPRLVVAGDGPMREAMREALGDAADRATFLGTVDREQALDVMAEADVVAMPSHAEGAGLVAVEASALGTCVVGTPVGVLPELLDADALVPVGDVDALAEKLTTLLEDGALRDRLADSARERVAADFTWEALAERIAHVYRRARRQHRGKGQA